MSSDTDSSSTTDSSSSTTSTSSSSSDEYKKRKHKKSRKRKLEKKKTKKSKKKTTHKDKRRKLQKPLLKPIAPPRLSEIAEDDSDAFGPALPPHLLQQKPAPKDSTAIIGPVMPAELRNADQDVAEVGSELQAPTDTLKADDEESDEDMGTYGPTPVSSSNVQTQLEERALELKIAQLEGRSLGPVNDDEKPREEWMLELPEVGLKGGLAALANMKRGFHQGREKPDFSDRTSWTKTPNDGKDNPEKPKTSLQTLKASAESRRERERDAEQERMAKKLKKKHKREESLMEIHQKKLRKEEKKKAKELAASGSKPERRPFSRDIDLKMSKIDSNQTKKIVDKAKILDSKFAAGRAKYL